ncbi:MAG: acetoacetate decarboxylase family protein [Streptosporangiaceae bacterium]
MPVEIRSAQVASAMFAVPAQAAQELIAYSGLEVARPIPGRAICSLAFVDYQDGDLGPYHEFAVAFLVHKPGSPRSLKNIGAFIHWLPVDGAFTLEAGRTIWGFPKEIAHLPVDLTEGPRRCAVWLDGKLVIALQVNPGLRVPDGAGNPEIDAYSCLDGVTRRTPWTMSPTGVRMRPAGATVQLGDHPRAEELRTLGLGRAHALTSTTVDHLIMSFGEATPV